MSATPEATICSLVLDTHVDIPRARGVYAMLDEALQREENVEIDASAVEKADTTGFQMLIVFTQTLGKHGRSVVLLNPSEAFMASAVVLGLAAHMPPVVRR